MEGIALLRVMDLCSNPIGPQLLIFKSLIFRLAYLSRPLSSVEVAVVVRVIIELVSTISLPTRLFLNLKTASDIISWNMHPPHVWHKACNKLRRAALIMGDLCKVTAQSSWTTYSRTHSCTDGTRHIFCQALKFVTSYLEFASNYGILLTTPLEVVYGRKKVPYHKGLPRRFVHQPNTSTSIGFTINNALSNETQAPNNACRIYIFVPLSYRVNTTKDDFRHPRKSCYIAGLRANFFRNRHVPAPLINVFRLKGPSKHHGIKGAITSAGKDSTPPEVNPEPEEWAMEPKVLSSALDITMSGPGARLLWLLCSSSRDTPRANPDTKPPEVNPEPEEWIFSMLNHCTARELASRPAADGTANSECLPEPGAGDEPLPEDINMEETLIKSDGAVL